MHQHYSGDGIDDNNYENDDNDDDKGEDNNDNEEVECATYILYNLLTWCLAGVNN